MTGALQSVGVCKVHLTVSYRCSDKSWELGMGKRETWSEQDEGAQEDGE